MTPIVSRSCPHRQHGNRMRHEPHEPAQVLAARHAPSLEARARRPLVLRRPLLSAPRRKVRRRLRRGYAKASTEGWPIYTIRRDAHEAIQNAARTASAPGSCSRRREPRARDRRRRGRRERAADERLPPGTPAGPATSRTTRSRPACPYTDATLDECTRRARPAERAGRGGRPAQHERDRRQLERLLRRLQRRRDADGQPVAAGPIWLGYYRSQNGGHEFVSSLVPGYPGDTSPYARARADPHGERGRPGHRVGQPRPPVRRLGDAPRTRPARRRASATSGSRRFENPDGPTRRHDRTTASEFKGTTIVAKGSSAPNLGGKFNDKTAIEADRTGGACDGNVYFAWSRFTGNGGVEHLLRPLDRPRRRRSRSPMLLTPSTKTSRIPRSRSPATATST